MSSMSLPVSAGAVNPPLLVDALVIRQLTAELDGRVHLFALDGVHRNNDQSVVEQQHIACFHLARQRLVIQAHGMNVAHFGARRVEHKFLPGLQKYLAFDKLAHPNLGTLQVGHDRHFAPSALGNLTY